MGGGEKTSPANVFLLVQVGPVRTDGCIYLRNIGSRHRPRVPQQSEELWAI